MFEGNKTNKTTAFEFAAAEIILPA